MLDEKRLRDPLGASVLGAALTLSCSSKPASRAASGTAILSLRDPHSQRALQELPVPSTASSPGTSGTAEGLPSPSLALRAHHRPALRAADRRDARPESVLGLPRVSLRVNGAEVGELSAADHIFCWPGTPLPQGPKQVEAAGQGADGALLASDSVTRTRQ
jgi:hypothetical protein